MRYIETILGVLSYADLAPHLARNVLALERRIADGEFVQAVLMNRLFSRRYPQFADYLSAPLVRKSAPNAPTPLSPEWVLRLTWTHLANLVRILKLFAPLRAVAYGCRQEALAKNAQEAADLGKQLYERIAKLAEQLSEVGNRLNKAVDAYNSFVATLESRVLVSARRFRELEAPPRRDRDRIRRAD